MSLMSIKRLLKKQTLTGRELGKITLQYHMDRISGKKTDYDLDYGDLAELQNRLNGPQARIDYEPYRLIYNFCNVYMGTINSYVQMFNNSFLYLMSYIEKLGDAERVLYESLNGPLIMSRKDYNRIRRGIEKEKRSRIDGTDKTSLIFRYIYYCAMYRDKAPAAIDEILRKAQQEEPNKILLDRYKELFVTTVYYIGKDEKSTDYTPREWLERFNTLKLFYAYEHLDKLKEYSPKMRKGKAREMREALNVYITAKMGEYSFKGKDKAPELYEILAKRPFEDNPAGVSIDTWYNYIKGFAFRDGPGAEMENIDIYADLFSFLGWIEAKQETSPTLSNLDIIRDVAAVLMQGPLKEREKDIGIINNVFPGLIDAARKELTILKEFSTWGDVADSGVMLLFGKRVKATESEIIKEYTKYNTDTAPRPQYGYIAVTDNAQEYDPLSGYKQLVSIDTITDDKKAAIKKHYERTIKDALKHIKGYYAIMEVLERQYKIKGLADIRNPLEDILSKIAKHNRALSLLYTFLYAGRREQTEKRDTLLKVFKIISMDDYQPNKQRLIQFAGLMGTGDLETISTLLTDVAGTVEMIVNGENVDG